MRIMYSVMGPSLYWPVLQLSNLQAWSIFIGIFSVAISIVILLVQLRYSFKGLKNSIDDIGDDVSTLSSSVSRIEGYIVGMDQPPRESDGGQVSPEESGSLIFQGGTDAKSIRNPKMEYTYDRGIFANYPVDLVAELRRVRREDASDVRDLIVSIESESPDFYPILYDFIQEHETELLEIAESMDIEHSEIDGVLPYGVIRFDSSTAPSRALEFVAAIFDFINNRHEHGEGGGLDEFLDAES